MFLSWHKERFTTKAIFICTGVFMKKSVFPFAIGLSTALFVGQLSAQAQTGSIEFKIAPSVASPPSDDPCKDKEKMGENLSLSYLRESTKIVGLLDKIKEAASLQCTTIQQVSENAVVLYGPEEEKKKLKQVLALLDLPLPGINMEMWGIQLSSQNATAMAEAMTKINKEVDFKRKLMQESYEKIQELVQDPKLQPEEEFQKAMTGIGYDELFDNDRPLSLTDILLRFLATEDRQSVAEMANNFKKSLINDCKEDDYCLNKLGNDDKPPFHRFLKERGLEYKGGKWSVVVDQRKKEKYEKQRKEKRNAVLDFALQYRLSKEDPNFDGEKLQASADKFNSVLQNAINEINADMEELFVEPTFKKIQEIASDLDVSYAQVGKISVATLNGFETTVDSKAVSAFDTTPPVKLSELLKSADGISSSLNSLVPASKAVSEVAPVSPAAIVGLIGAFGEQDKKFTDLTAGVSLTMTPNILRDTDTAELNFTLTTGPANIDDGTKDGGDSPISRVNQHKVKTKIYLKTLDLFTFSTFDNQSTKDGGRGYIPIVGRIWQGFFSDLPVVGNLFSWKKDPQNVYHQSVLLANTLITPTAMAIASVYDQYKDENSNSCTKVPDYYHEQLNNYKKQLEFAQKKKLTSEIEKLKTQVEKQEAAIKVQQNNCFQILKEIVKQYKEPKDNSSNGDLSTDKPIPNEMIIKQNGVN